LSIDDGSRLAAAHVTGAYLPEELAVACTRPRLAAGAMWKPGLPHIIAYPRGNEITELTADRLAMRSVHSPFPMRVTYGHRDAVRFYMSRAHGVQNCGSIASRPVRG
jgi:hypothetical protein